MKRTLVERVEKELYNWGGGYSPNQWRTVARRIIAMVRRHDKAHNDKQRV